MDLKSPFDLADFIQQSPLKQQLQIFESLDESLAISTFENLPFRLQKSILSALPSQKIAPLLNALAPDDRTSFLEELPTDQMNQLLKYLSPTERSLSIKLLGYPGDSVGRLMTPNYIAVKLNWTVKEVLDYIRKHGRDSETLDVIYGVDHQGKLIDDYKIGEILLADVSTKISDIGNRNYISLNVDDHREKAINIFRKYDRLAMPVIDSKGILLGIVTIDDIIDVAMQEDTEDIQKIGGTAAFRESYMEIPFFLLMKKRLGWLIILFLGEMLTASALGYYQDEIAKAVVLTLFLPLIISTGGNAGSQASTLIIRAMALGEVKLSDWWKIMHREIYSGFFLGLILGVIGFFRVSLWSVFSKEG